MSQRRHSEKAWITPILFLNFGSFTATKSSMPFANHFVPPNVQEELPYHQYTLASDYDLNFGWNPPEELSSSAVRVKLVPLHPAVHAETLFEGMQSRDIWDNLPIPQATTLTAFLSFLEKFRSDSTSTLFTVLDLSKPSHPIAGLIGLIKSSLVNQSTEIGPIVILPQFQRTHVLTHAASLLLRWLFDDLHLRRVQWSATHKNVASIKAGERMGLKVEAFLRWDRVLPADKPGIRVPFWAEEEESREGRGLESGRHTVVLGLGWDEWRTEGRANIDLLLERK